MFFYKRKAFSSLDLSEVPPHIMFRHEGWEYMRQPSKEFAILFWEPTTAMEFRSKLVDYLQAEKDRLYAEFDKADKAVNQNLHEFDRETNYVIYRSES
jgi:hypothetical protein